MRRKGVNVAPRHRKAAEKQGATRGVRLVSVFIMLCTHVRPCQTSHLALYPVGSSVRPDPVRLLRAACPACVSRTLHAFRCVVNSQPATFKANAQKSGDNPTHLYPPKKKITSLLPPPPPPQAHAPQEHPPNPNPKASTNATPPQSATHKHTRVHTLTRTDKHPPPPTTANKC